MILQPHSDKAIRAQNLPPREQDLALDQSNVGAAATLDNIAKGINSVRSARNGLDFEYVRQEYVRQEYVAFKETGNNLEKQLSNARTTEGGQDPLAQARNKAKEIEVEINRLNQERNDNLTPRDLLSLSTSVGGHGSGFVFIYENRGAKKLWTSAVLEPTASQTYYR
ncbi:hypothetical protein ACHAPU_008080 [Fusarium lateritium]